MSNGGTSILDYDIYFDQGIYDYIYIDTTPLDTYLMTGLTMGYTYRFKLLARNSFGVS